VQHPGGHQPVAAGGPAPLLLVITGPVGDHTVDQQPRRRECQPEAFSGEGVDVTRRITDEQHPPRHPAAHLLPQRARRPVGLVWMTVDALAQRAERVEVVLEATLL